MAWPGARVLPGLSACSLLFAASPTFAAETAGLHEDDAEDVSELEADALGTRGLLRTRAEQVSFDARERSLELSGNVRVDSPPFHLRSQHIKLSRTRYGIEADGQGRLAFCPCLGTPLTVEFDKAYVAPPGELILKSPKLELYGVPVLYLPWFWLRSDEKVGVLPPDIAYRGQDGMFVGEGAHIPWKDRGARHALDLRGGAYLKGGFVADARLRSPNAFASVRYDRLVGGHAPTSPSPLLENADRHADDGLSVDARGASNGETEVIASPTIAWDVDVLRGRRGVAATTDLDAAAKPYDRATMTGAVPLGPVIAETGFRAVTRRGGALTAVDASGPFVGLRSSGGASSITYDASIEGGAVRVTGPAVSFASRQSPDLTTDSVSYARAELGALAATTAGPVALSLQGRAAGDVAAEGRTSGADRAATARARVSTPLERAFRSTDPLLLHDPVVHVIEPFVEGGVVHSGGDAILRTLPGRGAAALSGTAPIADAGVSSRLGRWGRRDALELTLAFGGAYNHVPSTVRPLARGQLSISTDWLGATLDSALVATSRQAAGGAVVVTRIRLGRMDGARLLANVASRDGVDPVLARALADPTLEPGQGFLLREGTTGGGSLVVPWARALTTSVGADADATHQELVAARAGVELRDRCNCLALRLNGAHRIGRDGVDVWLVIDFATDR